MEDGHSQSTAPTLLEIKAAVDYISMAIRDSIREDQKMDWNWLYDLRTAGDILGMTSRQLILYMRTHNIEVYRNKFNNYKFLTADQIKTIRGMVLERVCAQDCYPQRKTAKVSVGSAEA